MSDSGHDLWTRRACLQRAALIEPAAFTLIGAGIGICLAMIYHQEPLERAHVYINDSMPFFIWSSIAGFLTGCGVLAASIRWPRILPFIRLMSIIMLVAAAMAPLGWIAGDKGTNRHPREGMVVGAILGGAAGLLLGVAQVIGARWGRRP